MTIKEDKLKKIRENGGTIHLKAGTFNTFEEAIDRIELKEDKQTVRERLDNITARLFTAGEQDDVTEWTQCHAELLDLFAHEYQSLKMEKQSLTAWDDIGYGHNEAVDKFNTLLDTKIQELQGGTA